MDKTLIVKQRVFFINNLENLSQTGLIRLISLPHFNFN